MLSPVCGFWAIMSWMLVRFAMAFSRSLRSSPTASWPRFITSASSSSVAMVQLSSGRVSASPARSLVKVSPSQVPWEKPASASATVGASGSCVGSAVGSAVGPRWVRSRLRGGFCGLLRLGGGGALLGRAGHHALERRRGCGRRRDQQQDGKQGTQIVLRFAGK